MAWPRTGVGTIQGGTVASGCATYMRWGTQDALPDFPHYIVLRINESRKGEVMQFDNGDGVQCGRMQIFHGVVWEVTVRDSYEYKAPVEGTLVRIVDMAGLVDAIYGNGTVPGTGPAPVYQARAINGSYSATPKAPGERTLTLERIKLIEG